VRGERILPAGEDGPATSFIDVLDRRNSERRMRPLSALRLSSLLWHAARTRRAAAGWERRAAPSPGGLHPTHTFVIHEQIELYDPIRHSLGTLVLNVGVEQLKAMAREVLPEAEGTLVVLVADLSRIDHLYTNAESLLWRDAGCAIALYQLVATWLGIACCPLGILGHELAQSLEPAASFLAVGSFLVGEGTG
jgi:hypothetical protein